MPKILKNRKWIIHGIKSKIMDFSEIDQENKYKDELRCGFPVFFNKITTLEEMN